MKNRAKIILFILIILLVFTTIMFINEKSEKDVIQKNIDRTFRNAISISMDGLAKDYSKMSTNDKIHYYYQTISNLKGALDMFHITSYKENSNLFLALNRLYIYLQDCRSRNYEIKDTSLIYEFLAKIMVYPEDNKLITEFNVFLENISD